MRRLMEYKIISGKVVEVRRSMLTVRQIGEAKTGRSARVAGSSSEKKIKANEKSACRDLARRLNATFVQGDIFTALKYDDEHLPGDYEAACEYLKKFMRKYRAAFKKTFEREPLMVWVNANWSPKRNAPARLHHHLVTDACGMELVRELWQGGGLSFEMLDNRGDHSDLAAYLIANVKLPANKKKYHCSRNVAKPIFTEPEPVDDVEDIRPEKGSVIKEHEACCDEEGRVTSSYLRCLLPERPRVRGGKVYIQKPRKRGGKKSDENYENVQEM